MPDGFAQVLETLAKAEDERVEPVLFLIEPEALRMAAAWRRLARRTKDPGSPVPAAADEPARWKWLWGQVEFSIEDWAAIANVPLPVARRLTRVLVENRVVYPDGTLHLFSGKYVQRRALQMGKVEGR